MTREDVKHEYFEWLYDSVCSYRSPSQISFKKLLAHLHKIKFRYSITNDRNRAMDGVSLRRRFAINRGSGNSDDVIMDILNRPCSVLEMIVALAVRCEESIMDDTRYGDRTGHWFWGMITNLGLGAMYDDRYDEKYVDEVVTRFMKRDYEPNGKGGLFTIRDCDRDLRTVEIWFQMCWYLDSMI